MRKLNRVGNMPPDRLDEDLLSFLPLRESEALQRLADIDGRTKLEELKWLIRARAFGRLQDLGDGRVDPQVFESDLSEYLQVKGLHLKREPGPSVSTDPPIHSPPRSK